MSSTTVGKIKAKIDWTKYSKRYRSEWEKLPECEGWLTRALGDDPAKARCKLCRKEMRAHLGDIKKHSKSDIHKNMMRVTQGGRIKVEGLAMGPKYTRVNNKYKEAWEDEPECEGWLCRSEYGARCNVCNIELMPKLNELKKHGKSQKHLRAMTMLWDRQGLGNDVRDELKPAFQPWQLPDIKKREFELKTSLLCAVDLGFKGTKEMCAILEEKHGIDSFSLTMEECKKVFARVIAPYLRDYLRKDMKDAPFSLVFDDATNILSPGQVSVCTYYFSRTQHKAVTGYLGLVRVDRNDVSVTVESVVQLLAEWELYGYNMISIITDGIAEICSDPDELVSQLTPTCPNLIHLHSSFSALFNAFSRAVKSVLPASLEFMLRESYNWFASNKERQLAYREIVQDVFSCLKKTTAKVEGAENPTGVETFDMKPIPQDSSQWMAIADFATGVFMHYDALKAHFEKTKNTESCHIAHLLHREFSNEHNRIYFTALQPLLSHLSNLRMEFGDMPETEKAKSNFCDKLENLLLSSAAQVLKPSAIENRKTIDELLRLNVSDDTSDALLRVDSVAFGTNFSTVLDGATLSSAEKLRVKATVTRFFREHIKGLQLALKDALAVMRCSEYFHVPNFLTTQLEKHHLVAPFFEQTDSALDDIVSKYKLMKMLDWRCKKDTLMFWQEVHDFGDATGNYPLRVLSNGVWKMLCVPLFNSEIDQTLRTIKEVRTEWERLSLHNDKNILEDVLVCKIGLRSLGIDTAQFQPPPELIKQE